MCKVPTIVSDFLYSPNSIIYFFHHSLSFVLYMTMRVRKEGLTQEEFGNEIGSSIPVAHAVEMNAAGGKYMPTQTVDDAEII